MFLTCWSPRSAYPIFSRSPTWSRTAAEMQIPPGSAMVELERGENSMHVGVVVVQRQRDLQFIDDPLLERAPVVTPAVQPRLPAHARHPGVSMGIVWIELDGATERAKSLDVGLARFDLWWRILPAKTYS